MAARNTNDPQQELQQYGAGALWNPQDPLMPLYTQIANTYKTNRTPSGFVGYCIACLIARQYLYSKKTPGDCGTPSRSTTGNIGADIAKIGSGAVSGLGAASAVGLAATGGSGFGGSAAGAGAALGGLPAAAGLAATGIGLAVIPFAIWGIISAHHEHAVAIEQSDLCGVSSEANAIWQQVDEAVASGQLPASQAINYLTQLNITFKQQLSAIAQECNAACVGIRVVAAICDLRTYLYKSAQQAGGGAAVQQMGASLVKSNGIVIAGLTALAAHGVGVF